MKRSQIGSASRRKFLSAASVLGAAYLGRSGLAAAEPPPEVTKVRLVKTPAICLAPEYVAEELLRLEGFTQIEYVERDNNDAYPMLKQDLADFTVATAPALLPALDIGYRCVSSACGCTRSA